ncbi:MAG: hypothetical protein ACK4Z8_15460, partial [Novosphingobium sp.]
FMAEAAKLPAPSRKPAEMEQDARRDARDARGNGGRGSGGHGRGGEGRGGEGRGGQRRDGQAHGGRAQGRDGRPRDVSPRQERRDSAAADRGPVRNPVLEATLNGGEREDGNKPRHFRPRGAPGVGAHRHKVRRAS